MCRNRTTKSSRAWLYGKLFVALLSQKLAAICRSKPPIGSRRRDFQFAFHRVIEAIAPAVGVSTTIERWSEIAVADRGL
jgi:hypothetical protein